MTACVHLLRHGEAEGGNRYRGVTDDPLTEKGWQQMWAAVESDHHWDRIIASPLSRCAEFGKALAKHRSIPFEIADGLQEMDFGRWDGRTAKEIWAEDAEALERFWKDPVAGTPPGGEPFAAFHQRVMNTWREITTAHPGQRLLLITHGGVIRVILCELSGHPLERLLEIEVAHATIHNVPSPSGRRLG